MYNYTEIQMVMVLVPINSHMKSKVFFVCNCGKKFSYAYDQATRHKEICSRMKWASPDT